MDLPYLKTLNQFESLSQEKKDCYLQNAVSLNDLGATQKVALLIKVGANVNKVSKWGDTPLMIASYNKAISNVALLIQGGANLDDATDDNDTALSMAINNFALDTASLLYNLMTEKQLFKDFNKEKRKNFKSIHTWLLSQHHTNNPCLILPKELNGLICFMYFSVAKKMLLQPYCLGFQELDREPPAKESKMLIFSQPNSPIKKQIPPEEKELVEELSLLSIKTKKNKRRGCVIS